jgi:hypothetical protein
MRRKVVRAALGLNLALLVGAGLWLRVTSLEGLPEVCGDEVWYGVQMGRLLRGQAFQRSTFSGNPLNPLYSGLMVPLLALFRPSGWIVRAPAVLCGILAVVFTYRLGTRVLDRTTEALAATLLAVLPAAIVFSRMGFDCSQLPLAGLLAIVFAFRGRGPAMLAALAVGVFIHPTAIFLLPVPLAAYFTRLWPDLAADPRRRRRLIAATVVMSAGACAGLALWTLRRRYVRIFYASDHYGGIDWGHFLAGLGRFLLATSLTPHEPPLHTGWLSATSEVFVRQQETAFWVVAATVVAFGLRRLILDRRWDRLALVAGTAASLAGFHVVAGSNVLTSPSYRYGVVLIVPVVLSFACLLRSLLAEPTDERRAADLRFQLGALSLLGWGLLLCAQWNWFDPRRAGTPESPWTFRSEVNDSYKRALSIIRRDHLPANGRAVVLGEDHWSYQPLRFYALGAPEFDVRSLHWIAVERDRFDPKLIDRLREGAYAVGIRGQKLEQDLRAAFPTDRLRCWPIRSHGERWLVVYRLLRPGETAPTLAQLPVMGSASR